MGKLIGEGGELIGEIRYKSGAKVRSEKVGNDRYKYVSRGDKTAVKTAIRMIHDIDNNIPQNMCQVYSKGEIIGREKIAWCHASL